MSSATRYNESNITPPWCRGHIRDVSLHRFSRYSEGGSIDAACKPLKSTERSIPSGAGSCEIKSIHQSLRVESDRSSRFVILCDTH